ncbi:hypothetical protein SLEP1_g6780 [Rubroshorea leprosula]|uniref:Secreted protein n=1 Tax=Rubroshorea leprosula TaxID=152421 RepID=A0AAV5I698_9ROSI|nr:hypothetical protein SLEP1_g6780 [Rubroshorea leprosula]
MAIMTAIAVKWLLLINCHAMEVVVAGFQDTYLCMNILLRIAALEQHSQEYRQSQFCCRA